MGWKIYSLGSVRYTQVVADTAIPILEELGYSATYSNESNSKGLLTITVDGTQYPCYVSFANTTSYSTYLMVNSDTNEIVVGQTGRSDTSPTSQMCYIVSMALLRGTATKTGEAGLFPLRCDTPANNFTNWWGKFDWTDNQMYLQKAVFAKYLYTANGLTYNETPFVADNIYWASALYTPGATVAVGNDTFLCINGCMFTKL